MPAYQNAAAPVHLHPPDASIAHPGVEIPGKGILALVVVVVEVENVHMFDPSVNRCLKGGNLNLRQHAAPLRSLSNPAPHP
jgi:hypothetical protein